MRKTYFLKDQNHMCRKKMDKGISRRMQSIGLAFVIISVILFLPTGTNLLFGQSGGDALFIDKNGNVGIGATSPAEQIEIAATKGGRAIVSDGGGQNRRVILLQAPGEKDYGRILAYKYGEKAGGRDLILQDTGGNVGIGTVDPKARLEIAAPTEGVALKIGRNSGQPSIKGLGDWLILDAPESGRLGLNYWEKGNVIIANGGGNVGIGATTPADKLDVAGNMRMLTGSNAIRFTSQWSAFPDGAGVTNQAEISNDTSNYKTLMIVGNKSNDGKTRRVSVWDRLEVNGSQALTGGLNVGGDLYVSKDIWYQGHKFVFAKGIFKNAYNVEATSDLRLKKDLQQFTNALEKIKKLRGVTYHWKETGLRYFTRDIEDTLSAGPNATKEENQKLWQAERERRYKELAKSQVGVIAQDVEAVLPEAVTTDEAGYKSVRYHYLIPLLIEALKEQDKTINDQSQILAQQRQEIARLVAANLEVQQQLADLAAVKAQLARLEDAVQSVVETQAPGASDTLAYLFKAKAH